MPGRCSGYRHQASAADNLVFSYQVTVTSRRSALLKVPRGEPRRVITVIFVNNGVYGMTGGQMAPHHAEQVTTTCPQAEIPFMQGIRKNMRSLCVLDGTSYLKGGL